jgi:hypothetical protein
MPAKVDWTEIAPPQLPPPPQPDEPPYVEVRVVSVLAFARMDADSCHIRCELT